MSEQAGGSGSFQEAVESLRDLLKQEGRTFQRERGRLLAEGHRGRFALVKGDECSRSWPRRTSPCTASAP
jgi:hypothetical protein